VQTSRTLMRLDIETRPHHAAADAVWRELLEDHEISEPDYAHRLVRVYGFEAPLEAALAYTPRLASLIDVRRRQRAGLIAQDLMAMDLHPSQVATLPALAIAPFATPAEALGWMYVVERATSLHAVVRQHLLDRAPRLANAVTYLSAYETSIGSRWLELGAALDKAVRDDHAIDQIIVAAYDGFRCAIDWYYRGSMRMRRVG
jgi:heme oxygenase